MEFQENTTGAVPKARCQPKIIAKLTPQNTVLSVLCPKGNADDLERNRLYAVLYDLFARNLTVPRENPGLVGLYPCRSSRQGYGT